MYLIIFVGFIVVFMSVLVVIYKNRINRPEDLFRTVSPLDSRELSVLAGILRIGKKDRDFDSVLWSSMGRLSGMIRIAYNAGCIVSASRILSIDNPETIKEEYLEICRQSSELRWMAFWAIPEILLNACRISYPRLHARQVAYLYSQIVASLRTQFEVFRPELLQNLAQVL